MLNRSSKLFSALLAAAAVGASGVAGAADVKWDLALFGSPAFRVAGESFAQYVTEKSGGAFTITVHNKTLSPAREVLDNLSIGAFECGYVVSSYHPGKNPVISALDLPFLPISSMEQRASVADALFHHPLAQKEFGRWGVTPVMAVVQPNYEIIGKGAAPTSPEAFDGMRMKATSGIGNALGHFGASLVSLTGAEQYNALQTGVIDAVAATPSAHGGWKLYELSEWYTVGMDAGSAHVSLLCNQSAYAALDDAQKALIADARAHAYAETIKAQSEAGAVYKPKFEEFQLKRVDVPAGMVSEIREKAARPVWDAYVADLDGKGLPGADVLNFVLESADSAQATQ